MNTMKLWDSNKLSISSIWFIQTLTVAFTIYYASFPDYLNDLTNNANTKYISLKSLFTNPK